MKKFLNLENVFFELDLQFFAQKKAGGSASTNSSHDSRSKSISVKRYGGQYVRSGEIILRQRGSRYKLGNGVYFGGDYTIHAALDGKVNYSTGRKNRVFVSIFHV